MDFPSAIIFVNNDLAGNVQSTLVRQLYINDVMSGDEFDARVIADPNYTKIIHLNNMRILVVRDFSDGYNRNLADVAIFIKAGLATIEGNKFGPPGQIFPVDRLTIYELLMKYPISGTIPIPGNVQSSILVPMFPRRNTTDLYPFGSDPSANSGGQGALIPNDYGDPITQVSNSGDQSDSSDEPGPDTETDIPPTIEQEQAE